MLVNILERTTHNAACWVSVNIKQFTLCLVDILGLCTNISKLTLGIVSLRCSDSVLYLCLSCVYCITHGSIPPARTHFPDFPLTTFKFHNFSLTTFKFPDFSVFSKFSRLVATLRSSNQQWMMMKMTMYIIVVWPCHDPPLQPAPLTDVYHQTLTSVLTSSRRSTVDI